MLALGKARWDAIRWNYFCFLWSTIAIDMLYAPKYTQRDRRSLTDKDRRVPKHPGRRLKIK